MLIILFLKFTIDYLFMNYQKFPTTAIRLRRPSTVNFAGRSFNGYDTRIFSIGRQSIDDFKLIIIRFD